MSVVFDYAAFEKEIRAFARSARATGTRPVGIEGTDGLEHAIRSLNAIATTNNTQLQRWTDSGWAPIRTTVSRGDFMPHSQGGEDVFARLTFLWEIRNYGRPRQGKYRQFQLAGNCSVRVYIHRERTPDRVLAMWRFEVGAHDGPGCHFHTQILGEKVVGEEGDPDNGDAEREPAEDDVFPHSLDVPRLPGFLITPTDALEFVLGELFQDQWRDRASDGSAEVQVWKTFQQERIKKILEFQRNAIADAVGSPWIALKNCKPEPNLIVQLGRE